jgi:hypothetical protein
MPHATEIANAVAIALCTPEVSNGALVNDGRSVGEYTGGA